VIIPEVGDTQVGANVLAGASLNAGFIKPFAQGRLTTDFDFTQLSAHLGAVLNF
jgi:hypothetical protein